MREFINIITESLLAEELPTPNHLVDVNAVVEYCFQEIDWSGGSGEQMIEEYCFEEEIDPEEDYVDVHSESFRHWFQGWCEERLWDAWGKFQHLFDGQGNATLYRVITAPEDWKPDARHPGIYWSWDEHAAEAHWGQHGGGHVKWRMTAIINVAVVDWPATLGQNVMHDYSEEREIRIQPNAPVNLVKVERL